MIRLIKKLHRTLKRGRHLRAGHGRLREIRPAVEAACGGPVRFTNGVGGGHDYVYFVEREGRRVAILRIANPAYVPEGTPPEARVNGPRFKLTPRERVAREWRVCEAGWPSGLTPRPLWRSDREDALLNSYIDGGRLFDWVQRGRISLWDAIDRTAEAAKAFHAVIGEAHMDLSLFNVYADAGLARLTLIDFELAPNPALSPAEARLFDFLNLVEMAFKDMSPADRKLAPQRLDRLLGVIVPDDVKRAPLTSLAPKLPRILSDPAFRAVLSRHLTV